MSRWAGERRRPSTRRNWHCASARLSPLHLTFLPSAPGVCSFELEVRVSDRQTSVRGWVRPLRPCLSDHLHYWRFVYGICVCLRHLRLGLCICVLTTAAGCGGSAPPTTPTPVAPPAPTSAGRHEVTLPGNGVPLGGYLYIPDVPGPSPALIVLHGWQPAGTNGAALVEARARRLADEAYVALALSLRGWPPSGGADDCALRQPDDVAAAASWLRTLPGVLPDRIALVGFSQGGQVALLAATRDPRLRAIVAYYPVTDVASWKTTTPTPTSPGTLRRSASPAESPRVHQWRTPVPLTLLCCWFTGTPTRVCRRRKAKPCTPRCSRLAARAICCLFPGPATDSPLPRKPLPAPLSTRSSPDGCGRSAHGSPAIAGATRVSRFAARRQGRCGLHATQAQPPRHRRRARAGPSRIRTSVGPAVRRRRAASR